MADLVTTPTSLAHEWAARVKKLQAGGRPETTGKNPPEPGEAKPKTETANPDAEPRTTDEGTRTPPVIPDRPGGQRPGGQTGKPDPAHGRGDGQKNGSKKRGRKPDPAHGRGGGRND